MIQRTDIRQPHLNTAVTSTRQDGPELWGQWIGRKHYSLEVVQHPLRARMCGFGDKDRRPLAPAAVAKMIVRREDDSIVDVDEVDCSFFLVTVDLWSADGKHEMNLVLHPSSTDRYVPTQPSSKTKRRGMSTSGPSARPSGNQTPAGRSTPTPSQYRPGDQVDHTTISDNAAYPQSATYGPPPPDPSSTWGYPPHTPAADRSTSFPPPILPSIHSFNRTTSTTSSDTWQTENEPEILPYRAWNTDTAYPDHQVDPALRTPASTTESRDASGWSHSNTYSSSTNTEAEQSAYSHSPYHQGQHTTYAQYAQPALAPGSPAPSHAPAAGSPLPRHTYTRTLVGPLSANACRLLDEHRKAGIFFLFQDLSVRTEGTFRLRMRLMNVGAPPAPEIGAQRVHTDVSPVLAQVFTEPFTVFSAKRFPGVPDTTALSIAFGNQGQKLPLRNRHGSSKRRRRGGSESDEDSDEA
ncbi:velvet factor-domain-containing protein [Gymnopilus junonius]|uniref:Velvet factor-domain-containing protein n=1 Tax=Gymnopilus junonius TaxID=109634 RepID=A0A9P5TUI1_GYMJU|nr:velvet factor-domain-containing protein [Gymnopilus junonius]